MRRITLFLSASLLALASVASPVRSNLASKDESPTDGLPYDAEVEYLESTGTQYINIEAVNSLDQCWELTVLISSARVYQDIFGHRGMAPMIVADIVGTQGYRIVGQNPRDEIDTYIIDCGASQIFRNGVQLRLSKFDYSVKTSGYLGLFWAQDNVQNKMFGRIYSCRCEAEGVLVYDLIPVRKGDVGYLYDAVSGEMFGNVGTGSFIVGPDKQ